MKNLLLFLCLFPYFLLGQDFQPLPHEGEVIQHTHYTLSYSEQHEQAEWVYYKLSLELISGTASRTDDFRVDPKVTTGSAFPDDYRGSGYDRGHLAPAADMKLNSAAMSETFYMSNMSPQDPSFNRGGWRKLEGLVRSWAASEGDIYVVTGPIFSQNRGAIGPNSVTVPGMYYKIIYSASNNAMIGFIMPNTKISGNLSGYVTSVDAIEQLTGIDFFYQLEDSIENTLESSTSTSSWDFNVPSFSSPKESARESTAQQCRGIAESTGKRCKNRTTLAAGYCRYHIGQANNRSQPEENQNRCVATTKAGNRCKRKVSSGNSYCWQHQ